mmetsp:Transcript_38561/g.86177  ORF Transcript_38561/g.86177 Transcript_38561/m.86177 type:complete len:205 (-) Transcript_38561:150-764(-)
MGRCSKSRALCNFRMGAHRSRRSAGGATRCLSGERRMATQPAACGGWKTRLLHPLRQSRPCRRPMKAPSPLRSRRAWPCIGAPFAFGSRSMRCWPRQPRRPRKWRPWSSSSGRSPALRARTAPAVPALSSGVWAWRTCHLGFAMSSALARTSATTRSEGCRRSSTSTRRRFGCAGESLRKTRNQRAIRPPPTAPTGVQPRTRTR